MKVFYLFLIALLIAGCGPSAEQITATSDTVRALTQTAAPTLTPTTTFTPTVAPSPTITPTKTPEPIGTLVPLSLSLNKLDGIWYGLTSEGKEFEIAILNNGVSSILIGFKIPGCESYSPTSSYYGNTEHYLKNGALKMSDNGITFNGTFGKDGNASGQFEVNIPFCEGSSEGTWTARYETPAPPDPALIALIPDTAITDGLFDREAGASNVSEFEKAIDVQKDWLLIRSFEFYFPLPAGWTTEETGSETLIYFSPEIENSPIIIRLGIISSDKTFDEWVSEEEQSLQESNVLKILDQGIISTNQAYFLVNGTVDVGNRTILEFTSRSPDGVFYRLIAYIKPDEWNDYYAIVRTMLVGWVDLELQPIGTMLPEDLGK